MACSLPRASAHAFPIALPLVPTGDVLEEQPTSVASILSLIFLGVHLSRMFELPAALPTRVVLCVELRSS